MGLFRCWVTEFCRVWRCRILLTLYSGTDKADKSAPLDFCQVGFFVCFFLNPESVTDKSQFNCRLPTLKEDPPQETIDLFPMGNHAHNSDHHSMVSLIKGHP